MNFEKIINMFRTEKTQSTAQKLSDEWLPILEAIKNNRNVLIHGGAGTGKTYFVKYLKKHLDKKTVLLAPTGMAALNAEGQTIHSFFHFPGQIITEQMVNARKDNQNSLLRLVDVIIIDEISMVRCELLDAVDLMLRRFGRDYSRAFGGAQIILCGDHFQLPPVVRPEDIGMLNHLGYKDFYYWYARSYAKGNFVPFELTRNWRQEQPEYISALNKVRVGNHDDIDLFNNSTGQDINNWDGVTLVFRNMDANEINNRMLNKLDGPVTTYQAILSGNFLKSTRADMPFENNLYLKIGARIMINKNTGTLVNGHIGTVVELEQNRVTVNVNNSIHILQRAHWESHKYIRRNGNIEQRQNGTAEQFPIRLAWAVTVHKSQGQTYDRVCVNSNNQAPFVSGQIYVALSRCKTIEGLKLAHKIFPNDLRVGKIISEFHVRLTSC